MKAHTRYLPITFIRTTTTNWSGLIVDGGRGRLTYTTVKYACSDTQKANVAVINRGQLDMTDSMLQECHCGGGAGERVLYIDSSTATVQSSIFTTSDEYPIYVLGTDSHVTMTENILQDNYYDWILLSPDAMMGHDTTRYAQTVWDGYRLESYYTVPVGVTLTLEPGVIIRAQGAYTDSDIFNVQGRSIAAGVAVFVAGPNRVGFWQSQPLRPGTIYTATITTGVRETSGDALVATHE